MGASASSVLGPASQLTAKQTNDKSEDVKKMAEALFQFMYRDWDTKEVWDMANKPEDYVIAISDLITNQFHVLGYKTERNQAGEIYFMKYEGAQGAEKSRGLAPPGHKYRNNSGREKDTVKTGIEEQRINAKIIAFYFVRLFQILGALLLVIKDVNLIESEDASKAETGRPIINQYATARLPRFQYGGYKASSNLVLGPYEFLRMYIQDFHETKFYKDLLITDEETVEGRYYQLTPRMFFLYKQPLQTDVKAGDGSVDLTSTKWGGKIILILKSAQSYVKSIPLSFTVSQIVSPPITDFVSFVTIPDQNKQMNSFPSKLSIQIGSLNKNTNPPHELTKNPELIDGKYRPSYVFNESDAKLAAMRGINARNSDKFNEVLEIIASDGYYKQTNNFPVLYVPGAENTREPVERSREGSMPSSIKTSKEIDQTYQALQGLMGTNAKVRSAPSRPHCIARALQLLDVKYINELKMGDTPPTNICKFSVLGKTNALNLDDYAPTRALAHLYGKVNPLDRVKIASDPTAFATSMAVLEAFVGGKDSTGTPRDPTMKSLTVEKLMNSQQTSEAKELQAAIDRLKRGFHAEKGKGASFSDLQMKKADKCAGRTDQLLTNSVASQLQRISQQLLAYHINNTVAITNFLKTVFNISQRPDGSWKVDGPKVDILFAGFPVLDDLTDTARALLVNYYSGCEELYQKGVKIWSDEQGEPAKAANVAALADAPSAAPVVAAPVAAAAPVVAAAPVAAAAAVVAAAPVNAAAKGGRRIIYRR
jgi:hypothetical protein